MSARTGDPRKTVVPKTIMAESTNEVTLDDASRNQISVSGVSGLAPSQMWGAGSGHCGKSSKHLRNFRVGTLNVNTLKGRVSVFLQDQNFWGSLMTPCLKIWGSLANLEGQNFFNVQLLFV